MLQESDPGLRWRLDDECGDAEQADGHVREQMPYVAVRILMAIVIVVVILMVTVVVVPVLRLVADICNAMTELLMSRDHAPAQ